MHRTCGLLVLSLLIGCHDAPRNNPLDPTLTPPVQLFVTVDDTIGAATLSWTPYEGRAPFAAYWVLRKVSGREQVDTLAKVDQVTRTTLTDTAMAQGTPYVYRVSVVNTSGLEAGSAPWETRPSRLPHRLHAGDRDETRKLALLR